MTERNEFNMSGEPKSDPTLFTSKSIEGDNVRNSRLLAQSSPDLNPVLLQFGGKSSARDSSNVSLTCLEHSVTPNKRHSREQVGNGNPANSQRLSRLKISSDYLSKDTQNILAALEMIIEGKDISSSEDEVLRSSANNTNLTKTTSSTSNSNATANITAEEFDIGAYPLKPKNGEKSESLIVVFFFCLMSYYS